MMLTATDIQGGRPERAIGSLLALSSGRCLEQTRDSDPQLALLHLRHTKPSHSPISIARTSVEGGAWILARVVVPTHYVCPGVLVVLDRTSIDSQSSHTVVNVQVCCLSPWSLKLGDRYSGSHVCISKCPPADFAIHYNTFTCCTRATICDVIHMWCHTFQRILSLACNWSIILEESISMPTSHLQGRT